MIRTIDTARRRVVGALLAAALLATIAWSVRGTLATLNGQTKNPTNLFATGTVTISDNASGTSIVSMTGGSPGNVAQGCITTTYTGSLPAAIKLYASDTGTLGPYVNVTLTQGTGTVPFGASCSGFTPDTVGSQIYNGLLSTFTATYQSFTNGLSLTNPSASTTWAQNNARVYQFAMTIGSDPSGQGKSSNVTFTWETQPA